MERRGTPRKYKTVPVVCTICGATFLKRLRERSPCDVNFCTRVCQFEFTHRSGRRWGVEESQLVQRLVADGLSVKEIGWLMGWNYSTIAKNGGRRPKQARVWSAQEDDLLRNMAPHVHQADIAALLERSIIAIDFRMCLLRLRRDPAFYAGRALPYHAYPPELREVIRLQEQLKGKLRAKEHRRSA